MANISNVDTAQLEREEKKIVEETQKAGGTVYEFDPHSSPEEKAAALRKVLIELSLLEAFSDSVNI